MAIQCRTIPPLTSKDKSRFWAKVDKSGPNGCWLWTAAKDKDGYGRFQLQGRPVYAQRVAYQLCVGPIGQGLLALHRCDNPPCVNPAHLFLGSVRDNAEDASTKGRAATGERSGSHTHPECRAYGLRNARYTHPENTARGERSGASVLTEAQVVEIRSLYAAGKHSYSQLSSMFGPNKGHIGKIIRRELWTHVA